MSPERLTKTARRMIREARELLADGSDPEYARGIVELVTYTLGIDKEGAAKRVGVKMETIYPGGCRGHRR